MLNIARKRVEAADTLSRSVDCDVSEQVIFAGEEHLHEILEGKSAILVAVEELDKAIALALTGAKVAVILQIVEQLVRIDEAVGITVDTLESRVGSKVANVAETLTSSLESALTLTNSDEQVLKSVFRFKAKHWLWILCL